MVACHSKLCMFFFYNKIIQIFLLWKFITQSHSVIVNAKTDYHITIVRRLMKGYGQFVIMITNCGCLTPYRFPGLVESGSICISNSKTIHQVSFVHALAGMFVFCQFKSQMT